MRPLDTLTNTLVSPFFYGLQSTSVSDSQGHAVLTGVHIRQNLPGSWTLQCGVDGVMMETPVFVNSFFVRLAAFFVEMTIQSGDFDRPVSLAAEKAVKNLCQKLSVRVLFFTELRSTM